MPWLAWTVVGLLLVLVLLSTVGKLVGKIFHGTPWWVRLGLVGTLAYAWSKNKPTQHYDAPTLPQDAPPPPSGVGARAG